MMKQAEVLFDNFFAMLGGILMALIRRLSKFVVAVPPAWYWGTIVYRSSGNAAVGIAAAVVLEIGGMLAAYYAVAYWGRTKGYLSAGLTVMYLLIGIGVMWLLESAGDDEKIIITAVFVVAGLIYTLSAMSELESQELAAIAKREAYDDEQEALDREHKRRMDERQQELDAQNALQIQLAHEKAEAEVRIAAEKAKASVANAKAREAKAIAEAKQIETSGETGIPSAESAEFTGKQMEIYTLLRDKPEATNTEIARETGVSRQYVGQFKQKLNGNSHG